MAGYALEWIKAGTVLAALIGIATTLYIGQRQAETAQSTADRQSKDAEESRAADRFDKALSRLAERDNPGARMSGVAGLRLFLIDSRPTHQREALHYLVTLLGEEKSPEVQQVFLDAFTDARLFTQEAKDDALRTAIEIDRSLTEVVINQLTKQKESAKQALLAKYLDKKIEDLPSSFSYSYNNVISLTFLQKMGLSSIDYKRLFYDPAARDLGPHSAQTNTLDYVDLINMLVSAGARNVSNNWTNIYCQKCDFTPVVDMSGAHFDESFLAGANFSHVKLRGATFRDADLGETNFFSSDLTDGDLSWTYSISKLSNAVLNATRYRPFSTFPYLECATLNGTNLNNLPLVLIWRQFFGAHDDSPPKSSVFVKLPRMAFRKFDTTTILKRLGIRIMSDFMGTYYDALPPDSKKRFEDAFSELWFNWPVPFVDFKRGQSYSYGDISLDDEHKKVDLFRHAQVTLIYGPGAINAVNDLAKPIFTEALAQPFWQAIPVTKKIISESEVPAASAGHFRLSPVVPKKYDCSESSPRETPELEISVSGPDAPG